jgi:two-component system cell cycle sensor histidine kinase/response regulator CckA
VFLSTGQIKDSQGLAIGIFGIAQDITDRKRLEEQLVVSQKMEAVGLLAGGVAHDFNNLLGVVMGYSDLVLDSFPPDDPRGHQVQQIKKAGLRATSLTRQLLAFSRKQIFQPRILDINALVTDFNKMLGRMVGEDIELVCNLKPGLGQIKADPGQIEQVIMNLVVNSRDAMPTGGKLIIETSNADLDEAYCQVHPAVEPGRYVMVAVSDTGAGMDAKTQTHIFEPFFTTKELGKGTGLGLATVYGVVKQSGGYIWVYSEVGKGTTFKIYLPRTDEPVQTVVAMDRGKPELLRGSETILLVEDAESLRELTRMLLENNGFTVLVAENGTEAIELAEHKDQPIHLLLTDVVMPGMSGRELANYLTAKRPDMSVIYMSGYTNDAIAHHGVLDSGIVLIEKPFSQETLIRKLREVLDRTEKVPA